MFFSKNLLPRNFFEKYETALYSAGKEIITDFANSDNNDEIYAFAFDADPDYCSVIITLNSEPLLKKRILEIYPHYTEEKILGVTGLKYNTGDFCIRFENLGSKISALTNQYYKKVIQADYDKHCETIQTYRDTFETVLISVLNRLKPDLANLNCTDHFIAYTAHHDSDFDKTLALMKQSVDTTLLNSVFPELKGYQKHLSNIQSFDKEIQFNYWITVYKSFITDTNSQDVLELKQFRKTQYDVKEEIVKLGKQIVPLLVDAICYYGEMPEFHFCWIIPMSDRIKLFEQLSDDQTAQLNCNTLEAEMTRDFLLILQGIGFIDTHSEQKLLLLLSFLQEENQLNKTWGLHCSILTRVLHSIFPERYPKPIIDSSSNAVKNINMFFTSDTTFNK